MPRLTLIGYRGTGKSTLAAVLGDRLGVPWLDADIRLEERAGCSIATLIGSHGEAAFRDLEAEILRELLPGFGGVLATGGGVVLRPANRLLLRAEGRPVVWLQAPAEVIRRRLAADPATAARRPALVGSDPLAEVGMALAMREPLYRETADVAFNVAEAAPDAVAERILAWLRHGPAVAEAP